MPRLGIPWTLPRQNCSAHNLKWDTSITMLLHFYGEDGQHAGRKKKCMETQKIFFWECASILCGDFRVKQRLQKYCQIGPNEF